MHEENRREAWCGRGVQVELLVGAAAGDEGDVEFRRLVRRPLDRPRREWRGGDQDGETKGAAWCERWAQAGPPAVAIVPLIVRPKPGADLCMQGVRCTVMVIRQMRKCDVGHREMRCASIVQ